MSTQFDVGVRLKFGVEGQSEIEKAKKSLGGISEGYKKDLDYLNKNRNKLTDFYKSILDSANQAAQQGTATLGQGLRRGMVGHVFNQTDAKAVGGAWGGAFVNGVKEAFDRGKSELSAKLRAWDNEHGLIVGTAIGTAVKSVTAKLVSNGGDIETLRNQARLAALDRYDDPHAPGQSINWIPRIEEAAERISRGSGSISKAQAFANILEGVSTAGYSPEHAIEFNEHAGAKALTVINALKNSGKHPWLEQGHTSHVAYDLARAAELRYGDKLNGSEGVKLLEGFMNKQLSMMILTQGRYTAEDAHQSQKMLKHAGNKLSEDFLDYDFAMLAQETKGRNGGGGQAGNAVLQLSKALQGGIMTGTARETLAGLKLLNADGSVKGIAESAGSDGKFNPRKWAQTYLAEATKGLSETKLDEVMFRLTSNQNAGFILNLLRTQGARMDREIAAAKRTGNLDDKIAIANESPAQAIAELRSATTNLWAAFSDPLMKPAIAGMRSLASAISSLGEVVQAHPLLGGGITAVGGTALALAGAHVVRSSPLGRTLLGGALGLGMGGGLTEALLGGVLLKSLAGNGTGGSPPGKPGLLARAGRMSFGAINALVNPLAGIGALARGGASVGRWALGIKQAGDAAATAGPMARLASGGFRALGAALSPIGAFASRAMGGLMGFLRLGGIAAAMSTAGAAAGTLGAGLRILGIAFKASVIGLLVTAGIELYTHWDKVSGAFSRFGDVLGVLVGNSGLKWLGDGFKNLMSIDITGWASKMVGGMEGMLRTADKLMHPIESLKRLLGFGSDKEVAEQEKRVSGMIAELEKKKKAAEERQAAEQRLAAQTSTTTMNIGTDRAHGADAIAPAARSTAQALTSAAVPIEAAGATASTKIDASGAKVEAALERLSTKIDRQADAIATSVARIGDIVSGMRGGSMTDGASPAR